MMQGKSGLAYVGVNALTPPDVTYKDRAPTFNDYMGYDLMHLWHVILPTTPTSYELWYLANKASGYATWIRMYPQGSGGGGNLRSDDLLIESPDPATGAINVYGGEPYLGDPAYINMYTTKLDDYTLYVNLKRSINQPNTNATATEGMYKLGSSDFMHNYGTNNTALGHGTLNLGLTVGVATDNTAIGHGALNSVANAFSCTACGSGALTGLEDGQYVTALGFEAGKNLDGADSDDIMIGSPGVLGDLNCIRIGQGGVGANQQDKLFIPAVWEGVAEPGVATGLTIVNANGKMYVDVIAPNAVLCTDATGNPIGQVGLDGEVLIGKTGDAPLWKTLTAGAGIGIANGPNSIVISAGGVGALLQLGADDAHTALPVGSQINIVGSGLINTSVTPDLGQDLSVNITQGTTGQVIAAVTGSDAIWKDVICSDGSILVTNNAGNIDFTLIGIPPVGGVNALLDHALLSVPPTLNHIQIEQGANITTVGDVPTSKITVSVTDDVDLPLGHMYCRDNVQTSDGSLEALAGHLLLPNTNNTGTQGTIRFNNVRWIHNYGRDTAAGNTFVGERTGNTTLTPASSIHNLGLGYAVLENLTTGQYNSFGGFAGGLALTSGSNNSGWGRYSLRYLTTGNRNLALGAYSGFNYRGAESDNILIGSKGVVTTDSHVIRIGIEGTGDYQQDVCYIAGIYNKAPGPSAEMVTIGSDGKLGTTGIPSGGATTFHTDSGNATVLGTTIQVLGGYNIGTRGSSNIVTVDVDGSIQQNNTTAAGDGIYAIGTRGAGTYTTNRFMHNYGTSSTYLGYQAGPISGTGTVKCVGIGTNALDAAAGTYYSTAVGVNALTNGVSANRVTCMGYNSGSALTTGDDNLLLGSSSGTAYTTESYNIALAHTGVAADSRTMRLGYDTQWNWVVDKTHPNGYGAMTTTGTTSAYLYGAFNSTVDETATPVYVDKTGKLGTNGGVMFAFRQTTSLPSVTGDGTIYLFGTSGGITVDFDLTSSITVGGGGAPIVFEAPFPGKYVFTASITMSIPASPPVPRPVAVDPLYVFTDNLSYSYSNYMPASTTFVQYVSEIVTTVVFLNKYEHVYWGCAAGTAAQAKNITIVASQAVAAPAPVGAKTCWATYFTGYRVG